MHKQNIHGQTQKDILGETKTNWKAISDGSPPCTWKAQPTTGSESRWELASFPASGKWVRRVLHCPWQGDKIGVYFVPLGL